MLNSVQDAHECDASPNGWPGGHPKPNSIPSARFKINVLQQFNINNMRYTKNILAATLLLAFTSLTQARGSVYNIRTYGAVGDGKTNDAQAIQKAVDACNAAGGGTVLVPAGSKYLAGPFNLKSFVEFYVETGATVLASPNENLYTQSAFKENKGEGTIWIGGENIQQVSIDGGGIIDGNGISFMGAEDGDSYDLKPFNIVDPRPHLMTIIGCNTLRIHDITIRNSAYWTVHLVGCTDVAISDVSILNSVKIRNSDGIDLDHSKQVRINNCNIESGDDGICFKNRREYAEYGPCENITVNNCILTSSSCAIKIGSENMDSIRHIIISNCIIHNSNRGLGIQNRDEGTVTDVTFSNIKIETHLFSDVWWGKAEPISITAYRRASTNNKDAGWRLPKGKTQGSVGNVANIYFNNIQATGENGVYVSGESQDKITGIYFNQVDITLAKTTALQSGVYDRRPSQAEGIVHGNTCGFYFDTAGSIDVKNCSVHRKAALPSYFGKALEQHNVMALLVSGMVE